MGLFETKVGYPLQYMELQEKEAKEEKHIRKSP